MTHHLASALSLLAAAATLLTLALPQSAAADTPTTQQQPAKSLMPAGGWKAGTHYDTLPQIQPMQAAPGQIEVIEFFWLACPHCYALEPDVKKWQKSKPSHVKFTRAHVVWNEHTAAHARFFYTLQELGRDDLQDAAFEAIHKKGNPLFAPRDPEQTFRMQTDLVKAYGVGEDAFKKAYQSPAVQARMQNAAEHTKNYRIVSVPMMAVAGKYTTDVTKAGGHDHLMELVNDLAAVEKR
jgi:thiol:disulfide interchange protein DsbA